MPPPTFPQPTNALRDDVDAAECAHEPHRSTAELIGTAGRPQPAQPKEHRPRIPWEDVTQIDTHVNWRDQATPTTLPPVGRRSEGFCVRAVELALPSAMKLPCSSAASASTHFPRARGPLRKCCGAGCCQQIPHQRAWRLDAHRGPQTRAAPTTLSSHLQPSDTCAAFIRKRQVAPIRGDGQQGGSGVGWVRDQNPVEYELRASVDAA